MLKIAATVMAFVAAVSAKGVRGPSSGRDLQGNDCDEPSGINCAVANGGSDRNEGPYGQINENGIFERSPCVPLTTELIIEFSSAPWDPICYQENGCAGIGACCRITENAECDPDNSRSTAPCICNAFTIGGLYGNETDSDGFGDNDNTDRAGGDEPTSEPADEPTSEPTGAPVADPATQPPAPEEDLYGKINENGIFERFPCVPLTTDLIIEFSSAPWDPICYQENGCAGIGACCRITENAECDPDNSRTFAPCICNDFTIGGLTGP